MSEKEESQEFKVVDKRRFSSDGSSVSESSRPDSVKEPIKVVKEENQHREHEPINFSSFVLGIYTHTLIFLGDIPHPETNEINKNLEAAKQNIDILTILEEKTKGNLNQEESQLMKEVLDMLRLQFISKK